MFHNYAVSISWRAFWRHDVQDLTIHSFVRARPSCVSVGPSIFGAEVSLNPTDMRQPHCYTYAEVHLMYYDSPDLLQLCAALNLLRRVLSCRCGRRPLNVVSRSRLWGSGCVLLRRGRSQQQMTRPLTKKKNNQIAKLGLWSTLSRVVLREGHKKNTIWGSPILTQTQFNA